MNHCVKYRLIYYFLVDMSHKPKLVKHKRLINKKYEIEPV